MRRYIYILLGILLCTSCSLDIVPDERPTEGDAFEDVKAVERYLYSCYAYLPKPREGSSSLDLMTSDEVVTAFEHETFSAFPKGNYSASNPVISYWNTLFQGIRQCYIFLNNFADVPGLSADKISDYAGQAKFLIAYYHYLLIRCYGPTILIKEEPDIMTPVEDYLPRSPYDECVQFVCDLFDEAASLLPSTRSVIEYGLATNVAAKALKAKMLLYAASPLFNGNKEFYSDFKAADGTPLMPLTYDVEKWRKAKNAYAEAIKLAEDSGYGLYINTTYNGGNTEPADPIQHRLRYNIIEKGNKEILWADCRSEGGFGIQNKSMPFSTESAWNGVAPTLAMLNRFYTKNGLPINEDPSFDLDKKYEVVVVDESHAHEAAVGEKTLRFNLDREPRFYAWVAFQGGFYEVLSSPSSGAYDGDPSYQQYSGAGYGKLVCDFVMGGNCSRGPVGLPRNSNYSPTGYLSKKGVEPANPVSIDWGNPIEYPWPIIRLAELYLGYAEACVELNELEGDEGAKSYLNKVRERAGIPSVEVSWEQIAGKELTQDRMRDIVRQERMIEFFLENQTFWDLRRWKLAEKYFGVKARGMDIAAETIEDFAVETEVPFERKFESPAHYLMPIPLSDVNKNQNLVQNPGY